ncbi:MAG: hypothetical protein PHD97_03875 [Bacteroidales bacterium]|nr:hypothetical protein [Bacteroidales bacterium]
MKRRFFVPVLIVIFSLATFNSCKKYKDGPLISMMPKKYRIANKWKVDRMFVNSIETPRSADWEKETHEFKTDGGYFYSTALRTTIQGTWSLDNKKDNLVVFTSSSFVYKILRLKNKEMWLEYFDGIDITETHYVPK